MSIEAMHSNAYACQSVAKPSKQMSGVALRGTTGQTMTNRQVTQPIWKTSSNTHKIPETNGKQPLKEGELKCYECGQKGVLEPIKTLVLRYNTSVSNLCSEVKTYEHIKLLL